jgi:mitochondrial fission protein ELM1
VNSLVCYLAQQLHRTLALTSTTNHLEIRKIPTLSWFWLPYLHIRSRLMLYHLDGRPLLTYHKPHMAVIDGKVESFGSSKRHDSFLGFSCEYLE